MRVCALSVVMCTQRESGLRKKICSHPDVRVRAVVLYRTTVIFRVMVVPPARSRAMYTPLDSREASNATV